MTTGWPRKTGDPFQRKSDVTMYLFLFLNASNTKISILPARVTLICSCKWVPLFGGHLVYNTYIDTAILSVFTIFMNICIDTLQIITYKVSFSHPQQVWWKNRFFSLVNIISSVPSSKTLKNISILLHTAIIVILEIQNIFG